MVFKINQHIASLSDYIVQGYTFYPSLKIIYEDSNKKKSNIFIKQKEILFNKQLMIKKIKFSHDTKDLININNFKINKNFFYILYGKSGTGKSTFADLISGFIQPELIEFVVDGVNYKNQQVKIRNIGYCNQDGFIFSGSFKDNITLFKKNYNLEMFQKALKIVELDKPKYKTLLNKSLKSFGRSISGGQKQRINIARMIYSNPEFLILDEATNSIDEKSEKNIIKNLKKWALTNKKTVILITHNPNLKYLSKHIYELIDGNLIKSKNFKLN